MSYGFNTFYFGSTAQDDTLICYVMICHSLCDASWLDKMCFTNVRLAGQKYDNKCKSTTLNHVLPNKGFKHDIYADQIVRWTQKLIKIVN